MNVSKLQQLSLFLLLLQLAIPDVCHGLAANNNNNKNKIDLGSGFRVQLPSVIKSLSKENQRDKELQQEAEDEQALKLLQDLRIQSNTEPKRFTVESKALPDIIGATIPAILRLGSGTFAEGYKLSLEDKDETKYSILRIGNKQLVETSTLQLGPLPLTEPLIIYELENCPNCKKVREACSKLSLTVLYKPCPKNGLNYRNEIISKYGETIITDSFPYLIDPNTSAQMFEADIIIQYLYKSYANDISIPKLLQAPGADGSSDTNESDNKNSIDWNTISLQLGLLLRGSNKGINYKSSDPPKLPIKIWLYESSPFCKIVKEILTELEIEHIVYYAPRGSVNRQKLYERTNGIFQVPYIEDPNTYVNLFESQAIIEYLTKQYGAQSSIQYL